MKRIHFILPGGGVKGSFQGGFLYELALSAQDLYTTSRIDGTSVGALNGYAFSLGEYENILEFWSNIGDIHDIFENWTEIPYLSSLSSGFRLFKNYGLYGSNNLKQLVDETEKKYLELRNPDNTDYLNNLGKFNCVVTAIRSGQYQYINGRDQNLKKYLVASACPWIVTCPQEIEGELYTDGGLLQTYPLEFLEKTESDLTIIIGYDEISLQKLGGEGQNTLSYLNRLIDILRLNSINIDQIKKLVANPSPDVKIIPNPMKLDFLDFNQEKILEGFNQGSEQAKLFIETNLN